MKKIGFIGAYDKTDLILYIAKILTTFNKKILVIDLTINQKSRYIIPAINPTKMYVNEYEEIDIAVGFENMNDIKQYLGIAPEQELEYDYVFIDTDRADMIEEFKLTEAIKNYFVTSFDVYSLKKGLEVLAGLKSVMNLTKILFSEQILKEDDDYLNFLALGHKIVWSEYRINFPIENGDLTVIHENQRVAKIKFRKLSIQYKDNLAYLAEEILGDVSEARIRRAIKIIEKGV